MTLAPLLAALLGARRRRAGAGLTAYAVWESRAFTLRRATMPVLPEGAAPLRVLTSATCT